MPNTYIGLTVGPIIKTIQKARSTRQIWVASYLFSWLVQEITQKLKGKDFLVPYTDDRIKDLSAGLYPDRFIFKGGKEDMEDTQKAIDEVIDSLVDRISKLEKTPFTAGNKGKIKKYLQDHLQVYTLMLEVGEGENPVFEVNNYLDTLELQPQYHASLEDGIDYLDELFAALKNWTDFKPDELIKAIFTELTEQPGIRSLSEIATIELKPIAEYDEIVEKWKEKERRRSKKTPSISLIKELKKSPAIEEKLLTRHKYVAVVLADGDNIGATIKALYKVGGDYQDFSKALLGFGSWAVNRIQRFDGLPVYAGGDDLLFFAPVVNTKKTIFDLADEINAQFQEIFKAKFAEWKIEATVPTLSFGISITYHKYPMDQAIAEAGNLLFGKAKKYRKIDRNKYRKNAIAYRILKASGTEVDSVLGSDTCFYKYFKDLMQQKLVEDARFLNSVTYKLGTPVVKKLLQSCIEDREAMTQFFKQSFDEEIHEDEATQAFFLQLVELILAAKLEFGDAKSALYHVHHTLRTLNFLNRKDND